MKRPNKRPRDVNRHAASTVYLATSVAEEVAPEVTECTEPTPAERHAAAVTLGRKGGQTRAQKLTAEQRKDIAQKAASARWRTTK